MMKKILTNIGWLLFDKFLRLGIGLVVVMWLARYLGPEQFGQLNFVVALVAVFGVFATLGLKGIVVRDLLDHPEDQKAILGSAFILKLVAALSVYLLLVLTIFIIKPDDFLSKAMVAILGLSLVFKSTEVVSFWFESQVKSKYVVWVENGIFMTISLTKMLMLWQQASLLAFIWVMLAESIVVGAFLFFVYAKVVQNPRNWQITKTRIQSLLHDSWPLVISSAAWIVYTRIDQIMIGHMLNDQALGYYSVAIKLSEMANIVPVIITFSIIPAIAALRKTNRVLYHHRFQMTYDMVVGLMLLAAIAITILSDFIITLFFGPAYADAAPVLAIHIWSSIFIAMATVSGKYLINEGLQKITMKRHLTGVVINIPLNYFMIPVYGIEGAAYASLFSLAFSNYIYDAITPATRFVFLQKTRAFIVYGLIANLWIAVRDEKN